MTLRCPKCRQSVLKEVSPKNSDVCVDACPTCKGLWFDAKELNALLDVAVKDLKVPSDARREGPICPRCVKPLFAFKYPQTLVTIDLCKECGGLWLDSGEFREVKAVRARLAAEGKLDEHAPVSGVKGALLRFLRSAMSGFKPT